MALEYYESERAAYLEETNQDDDLYTPGIPNGVPLTYLRKDVREICVLSCDFFETYIKDTKQTEIAPVPKYIKKRLYEHIEDILAGGAADDERVLEAIANHVITESYHHGNRTTKHNAIRNGLRYARVPGGKSCAFCLMLASRGFVYHSKTLAGDGGNHYHVHCHCRIVAGEKDTCVEGYKPEEILKALDGKVTIVGLAPGEPMGGLRLFDPQINRRYTREDISNYFDSVKFFTTYKGSKISIAPKLLRVDNVDFNKKLVDKILEKA